jgi:hypothetical protein
MSRKCTSNNFDFTWLLMILWNTRKIEIDNKTITGFLETGRGAKYIYNNDLSTDLLNKENTVIVFELDDSNLVSTYINKRTYV